MTPDTDEQLTVTEACRVLRCSRSTLYAMPYFRRRFVRVGKRGVRVLRSDIRLWQALQQGRVESAA